MADNNRTTRKTGLYIHIPFCVKKCNYCAFLSYPEDGGERMMYAKSLIREIRMAGEAYGRTIDSVYFGGGTPSIMDVSYMSKIMTEIRSSFDLAPGAEITLEANPGTLGSKDRVKFGKLTAYRSMGINRLSMGVQSMNNDRLRFLGRIHTAEEVARDVAMARETGFDNISLDLMFSVPGETTAEALSDAEKIIELGPQHISCYSMQLEEGTPFYAMAERGEISEVPDEEDRATYHRLCDLLRTAGYEHYEISNFARMDDTGSHKGMAPGFGESGRDAIVSPYRAYHNSLYWNMDDYIGLGLGASGFVNGARYRNLTGRDEYLRAVEEGRLPIMEGHVNTAFDNISEAVFTGLRRREGISYSEAAEAYRRSRIPASGCGAEIDDLTEVPADLPDRELFREVYAESKNLILGYCEQGKLIADDEGLRLTEEGVDISNGIMSLFV